MDSDNISIEQIKKTITPILKMYHVMMVLRKTFLEDKTFDEQA